MCRLRDFVSTPVQPGPAWHDAEVIVLHQAEWCPYSHRARLRLTELGLEWVARPQPVDRDERDAMEAETGVRSIPTLVDDGTVVSGLEAILAHLDARHGPGDERRTHRHRAQMRAEWPHWRELYEP